MPKEKLYKKQARITFLCEQSQKDQLVSIANSEFTTLTEWIKRILAAKLRRGK